MFRLLALTLISVLLPSQASSFSTEGCLGRKDPYGGSPPKPPGTVAQGRLTEHLVRIDSSTPGVRVDLKYTTDANFSSAALYPKDAKCWLRPALAESIKKAANRLGRGGFGVILYDCYRPWSAQVQLWKACPKRGLVGDPAKGSHHNRGAAVDLGLYRLSDGQTLMMPSAFDDLSHRARHSYAGGTPQSREHRRWLKVTMKRVGLRSIGSEWWHYQLPQSRRFPVLDLPLGSRQ